MSRKIILASSSPYRQKLLERLNLPFLAISPNIDESRLPEEVPEALVLRLAREKARALEADFPDALIIGADQVAELEGEILTKPGSIENAKDQLKKQSGKTVYFKTGLSLLDTKTKIQETLCETVAVTFRRLTEAQIDHYLAREPAIDCAGSFKSEGLGISLLSRISSDDPNTLIGLPVIQLINLLAKHAVTV